MHRSLHLSKMPQKNHEDHQGIPKIFMKLDNLVSSRLAPEKKKEGECGLATITK